MKIHLVNPSHVSFGVASTSFVLTFSGSSEGLPPGNAVLNLPVNFTASAYSLPDALNSGAPPNCAIIRSVRSELLLERNNTDCFKPSTGVPETAPLNGRNTRPISLVITSFVSTASGGNCAGITVGSLPGPDGQVSLREAVCAANGTAGNDTITFTGSGTYTLTRPNPGGVPDDTAGNP